jgi:hypothetical protein
MTSLSKIQHKYFVTRCAVGDVGIFSSNSEANCFYLFENVDQGEDQSNLADTHRDTNAPDEAVEEEKDKDEPAASAKDDDENDDEAVSEYTDGGTKIEK